MSEEHEVTTAKFWKDFWEAGKLPWHEAEVNEYLIKYIDELTGGRSNIRVFVPLCGKSVDMLWLADQGHTVVGVELAKQAIESFFTENNLTFTVESVTMAAGGEPAEVYKCKEKQITIFCCDLFTLREEDVGGKFDAIWDRGSMSAIVPSAGDRGKQYTKFLHSLLACDGNLIVESHHYEIDRGLDPPASISEELRNELFGDYFTIKELDVNRLPEDPNRDLSFALDMYYHLFKPKTS
ncbi:thiopurine S-methyltransferase-like [Oculina patagonica]